MKRHLYLLAILVTTLPLFAQDGPPNNNHGIMVRVAPIYIAPDVTSAKLGEVGRGREVIVLDQSRNFLHVMAGVEPGKDITGWIVDKGVIRPNTPDGDKILFGEAAVSELLASQRNSPRGAADDARRLYYRVYDYFPKSDLAGEGLYRAADILWQVQSADVRTRPSARQRDPGLHADMDQQYMKLVMKKFPGTKWADLAAFHLIEPKLCGDWEGDVKCPEKEADMYEKYASERPNSPRAPEALYDAAWRRAAVIEMLKNSNPKKVDEARSKAKATAQLCATKYPNTDWAYRCQSLMYFVDQQIPTYGNAIE